MFIYQIYHRGVFPGTFLSMFLLHPFNAKGGQLTKYFHRNNIDSQSSDTGLLRTLDNALQIDTMYICVQHMQFWPVFIQLL